jgi:hypothetical protein
MNVQLVESALSAHGRSLVVLDPGEVDDGPGSARNRGETALRCAARDMGPMALSQPAARLAR